jgi:cell division protease FtsH
VAESDTKKTPPPSWTGVAVTVLALLLLLWLFSIAEPPAREVSYSQLKSLIAADQVLQLSFRGNLVTAALRDGTTLAGAPDQTRLVRSRLPVFGDDSLLPLAEQHQTEIRVLDGEGGGWSAVMLSLAPWLLLLGVWFWLMQRAYRNLGSGLGRGGDLRQFLDQPAKPAEVPKVRFADVAGQDNAKREVTELVDLLRDPERYRAVGAEVPRGVLLMGPPGTGKTLLAKALAGEAGVPFFSISGSEFIEVFVGVGAARVRRLFETAKKNAPSIVFIDELDSVGRTRGTGLGGGHDEREQTLNQILAEMDGFGGREAVIVLAATNRPDVLDPALLRPGRFDRHVTLDLPDRNEREAILRVHAAKVRLAANVQLDTIAAGTPGFSGADLKNLVNEAAMLAARARATQISMDHFDEARDKLLLGTIRTLAIQPDEKRRLAVHEAGHTVAAYFLPLADPIYKVTIIPRGRALGGTHQLPEQERHTLPQEYLLDKIAVILGGRAAEIEVLGTPSSGADDDIRRATALARAMVSRWGMSGDIGPVDLRDSDEHPFLGREIAQPRRFSENSAEAVDRAVRKLIQEAETRALDTIRGHRKAFDQLAKRLEEEETLDRTHIEACLGMPNASQRANKAATL